MTNIERFLQKQIEKSKATGTTPPTTTPGCRIPDELKAGFGGSTATPKPGEKKPGRIPDALKVRG
jgi:hypothetical protein